jgi:hypothetical protein
VPRFVVSGKAELHGVRYASFSLSSLCQSRWEKSLRTGIAKASFGRNEKDTIERTRFLHEKLGCDVMIEEYVEGRELYVAFSGITSVRPSRERAVFRRLAGIGAQVATFRAKWDGGLSREVEHP